MNEYDEYLDEYHSHHQNEFLEDSGLLLPMDVDAQHHQPDVDFEDPAVTALPRILLMGPRRGGKTSIQVRKALSFAPCDYRSNPSVFCFTFLTLLLRFAARGLSKNVAS